MGSTIMHLGISEQLKQKFNFSNEFLIGAVAPDIIKRLPNTDRKTTHVKFLKDNSIHMEKDFSEEMYKDYAKISEFILDEIELDLEKIKLNIKKYFNNELINNIVDNEIKIYDVIESRENCFLSNEMIEKYFKDCLQECEKYISERKKIECKI